MSIVAGTGDRPVVLVTGASRKIGIGAAICRRLARDGWNVASTYWRPYDERMAWGSEPHEAEQLGEELTEAGATWAGFEVDLSDPDVPARLLAEVTQRLGPVRALVLSHCESVDAGVFDTTVESFDLHMAVNARATWLLIRAFGERFCDPPGTGRIVALTSDDTVDNLAYGASKGALDRIVLAAATELAHRGITASVINPGATDTGWMTEDLVEQVTRNTLGGRVGRPDDCANLVAFLCSNQGGWINGQLLHSNGGLRPR